MAILLHLLAIGVAVATAACSASQPPQATGSEGAALRQPRKLSRGDYDDLAGGAEVLRSGADPVVRVQPRRVDPRVPAGGGARSRLRDVLLGRGVRATGRTSTRRSPKTPPRRRGRRSSRRGASRLQRAGAGTRLHRCAREALHRRSEGRARAARSRLRRRDARGRQALSRRSRRGDALRAVADGYLAVELLGEGRQPAAVHRARCSRRSNRCWRANPITSARSTSTFTPSKRRPIPAARRSMPTSSARSFPAPAIWCTCRRISTCAPAATTTPRS